MYNQKCFPSVETKVDSMDEELDRAIYMKEAIEKVKSAYN